MDKPPFPVDQRRYSPSIARNKDIVRDCLSGLLESRSGHLLEIGSGTGEHGAHCATALKNWHWSPSDAVTTDFQSVAAWRERCDPETQSRINPPVVIDCLSPDWPAGVKASVDVIFAANVIHITPPALWPMMIKGAATLLRTGGVLAFYGPFRRYGQHTASSNVDFDRWLAERDPSFAVRDWEEMTAYASPLGFDAQAPKPVPSNNFFMHLIKR